MSTPGYVKPLADDEHGPRAPAFVRMALVLLCLLGVYTNLSLPLGESRLYAAPAVFGGWALVALRLPRKKSFYRELLLFTLLCGLIIVGGPNVVVYGAGSALSAFNLFLSIVASYGLAYELIHWPTKRLRKLALYSAAVVCTLTVLEAYGPLARVSDAFRTIAYSSEDLFLYAADARDEYLHGGVRPKAFTQEPSHPAKFAATMIVVWFLVATSRFRMIGLGLLLAAAALSMRSPSLAIAVIVLSFVTLGKPELGSGKRKALRATVLIAFLVTLCSVPTWIGLLPFERARAIAIGDDASSVMRMIAPIPITVDVLSKFPLFGLGLGSKDVAFTSIMEVFAKFDAINLQARRAESAWSNGLFQLVCYMGILGSLLFFGWLKKFTARIYPGDFVSVLICFTAVFSAEGTFGLLRPWLYFFMLLVALFHRRQMRIAAEWPRANRQSAPVDLEQPSISAARLARSHSVIGLS